MIIYDIKGKILLDITVDDSSYSQRTIMGDNNITLHYSLAEHVELPVGAWCEFQNVRYTLMRPENFKKKHSRNFEYTVIMEAAETKAKLWKFRNMGDGRLKFPLTAKPHEHLQMFVDNMNRRDSGWTIGDCIAGTEVLISYDHAFCYDALAQMASELKTEFEIEGKTVSLRKVEYNKNSPLSLSYGRGNGFKPGVGRANFGDKIPVEILFVQGGSDNIDRSKYGSSELLMPKNQQIAYDGEHFEDEDGFNIDSARTYIVDDMGLSIRRADRELTSQAEDSLDCSEIYPKRVGTVSAVVVEDADNHFYDIVDSSIPAALDYEKYRIGEEPMTIRFQSGMLVGKEFDIQKYYHEAKGEKTARRFEIVPQEIDGQIMPNDTFAPAIGDTYAIFNCTLPDAYICDNSTKTGAEWDMFRAAVRYMFDNEEMQFSFTGELDGLWAKKDWVNIGGRIRLGGYIRFSDEHFQQKGVLVRITGIKYYINNPHSPELTLSNSTVTGSFSTTMRELKSEEVVVEDNHRTALQFTKRRFRDAQETMKMLEDAMLDNFTNSISPLTVQTMMMLVGDESLQFRFVNSLTDLTVKSDSVKWDNNARQLTIEPSVIQHMTLGITNISSDHSNNDYKVWSLPEYTSAILDDKTKKFFLYAKVSKTVRTGKFLLSETAIGMEDVPDYYHLLVGVLNSEYNGERSYVSLYGFSEILPGQITTDVIRDSQGKLVIDLANAIITAINGAKIIGNISIGSGSSGLTNLSEWAEKQQQLDDAAKNAQAAKTTAETANKNAEEARKSAQSAATELEIIQSDEYVSAVEKRSLKLRQADMQAEYPQIVAEAEKYGLAKVEGPFQSTPEYWEQGSANSQYTGYLWDDMKFESTKDIRTQMLLYAFAKAKFSVGTGFMVQAVCFGEDMRSISRTGAAQSITITDENTAFVSLIISKTSDVDIAPEELVDASLTVSVESSGGGETPDDITASANWEQGSIISQKGQSYADDKYGTMSYMVRLKNLISTPVGNTVSIGGPYQFCLYYYDAGGLSVGVTDYWPTDGTLTNGHSIVAKDYPYMAVVIRKLNSAGTSTVDLTPSDIASSGFTLGDGSSGGGEVPPSADDILPVEQPSTDHVTGFEKAYNAANAALTKYTASTPENIPTESDFGDIYGYYTARQIILDAIADAVKEHFDAMSDYEYLKEVFPNMVLDSNGVFLSRLMAVKDSAEADAAVVAGMYGGGVETLNNDGFRDPTHGTLMFFAGATDVQNAAAANTRIYGDGSQFTKKLYANGGEIGGFTISEDKLVSGNYDVGEEEMTLSKEKIRFRHKGTSGEVYIGVNNPVLPPSLGAISCLMSVENKNPASDNRIGILIEVDGNLEALLPDRVNAAVWAESGSFVGFRPRSTYVESGQTNLDYLDSVVYVNTSSGNAVLTLPTNPQPDQMYMIRKLYAANSVSVGSSNHRIYLTGSDTPAYTATWTGRRAGIIQYNRTLNAWVLMFTFEA